MQLFTFCLWFSILFSSASGVAAKKEKESSSNSKDALANQILQELNEKVSSGESLLIATNKNFTRYIKERPRKYHAIIMLTALAKKYKCSVCHVAAELFEEAASYYNEQYVLNVEQPDKNAVFFLVDIDSNDATFRELNIQGVPIVYAIPPRNETAPRSSIASYEVENSYLQGRSVKVLLDSLESISGIHIEETVEALPVLLILTFVAVGVSVFAHFAFLDLSKSIYWYRSSILWLFVSAVVFSVGVSGSISCIIRGSSMIGYGRDSGAIFASQGRDQYILEGLIISLCTIACAFCLYFAVKVSSIRFPLVKHAIIILSLTVFTLLLLEIWENYTYKTSWYRIKETLPPEVNAWLKASVKKSSGLLKRIIRVCEIYLFEFKDLESFRGKFKSLLLEYIDRAYFNSYFMGKE